MGRAKMPGTMAQIPSLVHPLMGAIRSEEELEYGLRGVVRILGGNGRNTKNGYFFNSIKIVFASEIGERIEHEETFLDYENSRIIVKLPDVADLTIKDLVRHEITKDYTMGADDLKTRAALIAFFGLNDETKKVLIEKEKALDRRREAVKS